MKKFARHLLTVLLVFLLFLSLRPAWAQEGVRALFINVGKADAALFWLDDAVYLVDTGHKNSYDQLQRVLDACQVRHLDGIILTHTDKDHVGGLKKLLKSGLAVERLYAGVFCAEEAEEKHPVREASEKYGIPIVWLGAGDRIEASARCVFEVLGPLTRDMDSENNNSLVLRLATPEGEMLLTGDMEHHEEMELIQAGLIRKAQVLKVAHHGEDDSTSRRFVLLVRPQWSVISTNTEQEPDTPDPKVLSLLSSMGSSIAVTQDASMGISVTLDGGTVSVLPLDWE